MTEDLAIAITGLSLKLGRFQLGPLSLDVPRGCVLAFIGPNGAGKTTLLDLVMGLGRPDKGEIQVLGYTQPKDEVAIKLRTAYVNPDLSFAAWGRVGRALDFVSGFYPDWDSACCERLLADFKLSRNDKIAALSFGGRIKLSLIMALSREAELLLLDEPTVGLDVGARRVLFAEILEVVRNENRTVVMSSHQLSDLERIADQVLILNKGRVLAAGRMDQLLDRFAQVDATLLPGAPLPEHEAIRLLGREGDRVRLLIDTARFDGRELGRLGITPVAEVAMTLEDLFVALISE